MVPVGKRIRQKRQALGLSQAELSKRLGISRRMLQKKLKEYAEEE